jgi:hypothetical protein
MTGPTGSSAPTARPGRWPPGGRWSLRARLTLILATVFVLLGGALIALTASLAQGSLARAYSQTAPAAAALKQQIAEILRQTQPTSTTAPSTPPGKSPPPGSAVPSGKPSQPARPTDTAAAQSTPDTKQKLLAASDLYSTATRDTAVHDLIIQSIAAAGVLIPLAVLLAWWLAGRSLRPIRRITSAARRATPNSLSERIALTGRRDEITELGDTFDAMMDRLEHAFDAQRRFIANASHELRTPLAIAGTAIDVVLAKPDRGPAQLEAMAGDVREALHRAERLVDSLLALTRSQHLDHPHEPVDLAAIAEDVLDEQRGAIVERSLTVSAQPADARAVGDRVLLHRMVANLIENAIRHNVDGGHLDLRTASDPGTATLEIANTGPVVPADQVARLVEPFQRLHGRASSSESGLGLGLAIARAVADAHGARLTLAARPDGGLAVAVHLPVAVAPRPPAVAAGHGPG